MTRKTKLLVAAGLIAATSAAGIVGVAQARDDWQRGGGRHGGWHHSGWHHGGGHGRGGAALIERFDSDGDGALTQAEIDQTRSAKLAQFDANGDGNLSLDEFQALWLDFMRERMVDRFQDLDADGDASVTAEEFARPFDQLVQRMDRNGDGKLSLDDRRRFKHGDGPRDRGQDDD